MKKSPRLILSGGLGNQLFQICAGIEIQNLQKEKVYFDVSNLRGAKTFSESGNYTRLLEVEELIPSDQIVYKTKHWMLNFLETKIKRKYFSRHYVFENGPNDNVLLRIDNETKEVYGFFQSSNLVEKSWQTLIEKFRASRKFRLLLLEEPIKRIAIHIRFGDYSDDKKTKSFHGLTEYSYYKEGIDCFANDFDSKFIVAIVTDDISKAKSMFAKEKANTSYQFISNPNPISDLLELARSSHVIISNSTFSWWGAWIAFKVHNSKVIYPRPWFANESDPDLPIYVDEWLPLKRKFETN